MSNKSSDKKINSVISESPNIKQKDFTIRMKKKKGSVLSNKIKRKNEDQILLNDDKRPATKEAVDRGNNISQLSDEIESASCQFNTEYPIKTPNKQTPQKRRTDSNPIYGLSKTNDSFNNHQHLSNQKAQDSTVGFSSSTHNTTGYSKSFGDSGFRSSKYTPGADQSSIPRSSYYK